MALKKDKQKVLGETFDEERVKGFLNIEPRKGFNTDFLLLERAYRGMKAENFHSFVSFFAEAGKDINACDPSGRNLLQIIQSHASSADYSSALKSAGAKI